MQKHVHKHSNTTINSSKSQKRNVKCKKNIQTQQNNNKFFKIAKMPCNAVRGRVCQVLARVRPCLPPTKTIKQIVLFCPFCFFCFFGIFCCCFFCVFRGPGAVKQEQTSQNTETNSKINFIFGARKNIF